jgi:hypothetical protein
MIKAVFDTGSTNMWILKNGKNKGDFDSSKSKTIVQTTQTARVSFGSGKIMGHFYTDKVFLPSEGNCD